MEKFLDGKFNDDIVKCSAVGCLNKLENNSDVVFFKFPRVRARCKTWLINCGRTDLDAEFQSDPLFPSRKCWLCSDHFEQDQFVNKGTKRLIARALPTLFNGVTKGHGSLAEINEEVDCSSESCYQSSDVAHDDKFIDACIEAIETISDARVVSVTSLVTKLVSSLVKCSDDKFNDRLAVVGKLLEIWSDGEDVELRCNDPPQQQLITAQLSSADVQLLANRQNAPVYVQFAFGNNASVSDKPSQCLSSSSTTSSITTTYRQPVMPRRKPGDPVILFPCKVCSREFRYYSQLEQHLKHHAGVRPYSCHVCGQQFALECSRDKHLTIHSNEKPLMCDTCGQCFAHISYLKSHQRTHSRDRPYACQECEKKFAYATSLRHHMAVTHADDTGSREQFSCHQCGLSFPTMSQVRVHVRSHVKEGGVECGEVHESTVALSEHINTVHRRVLTSVDVMSSQYSCTVCSRVFTQSSNLRRHMLTHSGQRAYQCSVCDKQFSQPSNLKAHERTHSSQQPYSCVSCGSEFTDSTTLQKHILHDCYTTADTLDTVLADTVSNCNVDDMSLCGFD